MNAFVEGVKNLVAFVLSCFDRVVITGTLPDIAYPDAMARFLGARGIRLFDFPQWAETVRDVIRRDSERLAAAAGLEIKFVRSLKGFRKEARIKQILAERGEHPGLVHIFSAMESCSSYRPWYDKPSGRTLTPSAPSTTPREAVNLTV